MLGTRRKDLPQNRPINSKVFSISDECIELKNSVSLTSSSSYSSSDDNHSKNDVPKVSNFMKNAAPSVLTKYIKMNKMNSPFVESGTNKSGLYQKSIFSAALAVKTGKQVNVVVDDKSFKVDGKRSVDKAAAVKMGRSSSSSTQSTLTCSTAMNNKAKLVTTKAVNTVPTVHTKQNCAEDTASLKTDANSTSTSKRTIRRMKRQMMMNSDHSITTDMSSLSGSNSISTASNSMPRDTLTTLQKRVLKVKKFKEDKGCIGRAAGLRDDKEIVKVRKHDDYKAWKAKRSPKMVNGMPGEVLRHTEEGKVHKEMPPTKMPPPNGKTSVKQRAAALEQAYKASSNSTLPKTTTNSKTAQYELLAKIKASPPPPPPPPEKTLPKLLNSQQHQYEIPFDETNTIIHHDKIEIVALHANETVIIDKSRNVMQHTVQCEDDDASRRRMELLDRARSLITAA